jgi:integrase
MSLVASDRLIATLDGSGLYTEERNLWLWEQVPEELRLVEFSPRTLPDHPAFRWKLKTRGSWRGFDLYTLPEPMRRELAYCFWQIIESGLTITNYYGQLVWWLIMLDEDYRAGGRRRLRSFMDLPLARWERELAKARTRRTGKLHHEWVANGPATLRRCYRHLVVVYDPRDWWQHDVWSPKFDARIPTRTHEPNRARSGYDFLAIDQPWLRQGAKWYMKVALETGLLRWPTIRGRLFSLELFGRFIAERGIAEPWLCADPTDLRLLALDFLAAVKQRRAVAGPRRGELIGGPTVHNILTDVEQFYAWMADHRLEAARALGDRRWERLGDQHTRLWRPGEKPRISEPPGEDALFDETTMAQLMRHAGVLAAPKEEGGLGDEQAMRILMLLARTGRRVSEILLLDFDPILPITGLAAQAHDSDPDAVVAKLRFQQTKIDGAPDTIFVDQEVVAIVRAQQEWAHAHIRALLRDQDAPPPRYLFLAVTRNNRGRHPYPKTTLRGRMEQLGEVADIRDSQGRRPPLGNVHRFRHTRATSLINANVPVHVVQRYLGHLSPKMTMHYSKTLRETHEREFLRYRKITADGDELELDSRDLFALIELDKRTDRVLPNGLCMLPPRQACNRGNACLTCDKFTTDASYLPEHEQQLQKLNELIAHRQAAFRARTGEEMSTTNVWLEQRLTEQRALEKIITVLTDPQLSEHPEQAVRGPGTGARAANQLAEDDTR